MNVEVVDLHDIIVLQEKELHFSILEKCFSSYSDMAKCKNTILVVNEENAFAGVITLGDYRKNLQNEKVVVNSGCKKIVSENREEAMAQAFLLKQQYDFLKLLPVVDSENKLCYAISMEDIENNTKNIRDFCYWMERNSKALDRVFKQEEPICVCGTNPFEVLHVAGLCKRYWKSGISVMVLGDEDYVIRNEEVLDGISLAQEEELAKYTQIITIDVELYGLDGKSVVQLNQLMSEELLKPHSKAEDIREQCWLHIGDLLTPCNGKITGVQFFIISRVLDVERRRENLPFYWQNRFNEYFWPQMTRQEEENMEAKFDLLIHSLNRRGFNPNVNAVSITDCPVGLNDGAHRTAWHIVYAPDSYVPCYLGNRSLSTAFWPLDGEKLFIEAGLPKEELEILQSRYRKMIENDEIRTSLTGYVKVADFDFFASIMRTYGEIVSMTRIEKDSEEFIVFRVKLFKQWIYYKNKKMRSKYVEAVRRRMRMMCGDGWGRMADTVTTSIELENSIEGETLAKLEFICTL